MPDILTSGRPPRRRLLTWSAAVAAAPLALGRDRQRQSPARAFGVVRTYYIAADTVTWNYVPQERNLISGYPFTARERTWTTPGPNRLGAVYEKSRYRRYTDATFTARLRRHRRDAYQGILGPVIRAQVGDTVRVVFRNNTTFHASMHPHGMRYTRADEGALYDRGAPDSPGDAVAPGDTYVYTWQVPERAGPGPNDPSSIVWLYHDHSIDMGVPGAQAGLVGPLVVTRRGAARPDGSPADVDREAFALFTEFDENASPHLARNIARYAPGQDIDLADPDFQNSNRKSSINGYMFGNGPIGVSDSRPALAVARGERVRWYLLGLGGGRDSHSPHWHGNTVLVAGQRTDVVNLMPATMITADMLPDASGVWLFHCHVDEHMTDGMMTRYLVTRGESGPAVTRS